MKSYLILFFTCSLTMLSSCDFGSLVGGITGRITGDSFIVNSTVSVSVDDFVKLIEEDIKNIEVWFEKKKKHYTKYPSMK